MDLVGLQLALHEATPKEDAIWSTIHILIMEPIFNIEMPN
jgi:hypothetical protein